MLIVETERLILRNWQEEDRNLFYEINRDEKVMEFFPFRRSHAECDTLFDLNRDMISQTGLGFYALANRTTNEAMGFCGLSPVDLPGILPEGAIEIGWRLATRFWGRGYVTEAASRLIEYARADLRLPTVYAFAVDANLGDLQLFDGLGARLARQGPGHPEPRAGGGPPGPPRRRGDRGSPRAGARRRRRSAKSRRSSALRDGGPARRGARPRRSG